MRNKKGSWKYKGFRELCRECNGFTEIDYHHLVPASERNNYCQ